MNRCPSSPRTWRSSCRRRSRTCAPPAAAAPSARRAPPARGTSAYEKTGFHVRFAASTCSLLNPMCMYPLLPATGAAAAALRRPRRRRPRRWWRRSRGRGTRARPRAPRRRAAWSWRDTRRQRWRPPPSSRASATSSKRKGRRWMGSIVQCTFVEGTANQRGSKCDRVCDIGWERECSGRISTPPGRIEV